jgi:IS30 family transposase
VNEIARTLKRHRATIFRERRRNHFEDAELPGVVGYFGLAAQTETIKRRSRQRKLIQYPDLCKLVVGRIGKGWTPEQIAGRMRREKAVPRVCQETIYRYIYSKEGMSQELWWYLQPIAKRAILAGPESACRQNSNQT